MTGSARHRSRRLRCGIIALCLAAGAVLGFDVWIRCAVLPSLNLPLSATVTDREGRLLRAYTVEDGLWRLPIRLEEVDRGYLDLLIAYEDQRFHSHNGVDLLALLRAAWQALRNGRVVSGGSTLSMQVARLLEDGPTGTWAGKLRQIRLAVALERRLPKERILALYLTLAPFGGNIEGLRAASLSYLGKEPRRLTVAEAALLVALPQAPEARRPDRHHAAARHGRARVLTRAVSAGVLSAGEATAAEHDRVPSRRRAFPMLAPHLTDRIVQTTGSERRVTLDRDLQGALERLLAQRAAGWQAPVSAALMVADHRSGDILASLGTADLLTPTRRGWVDMTRAPRSPGSALKPLIYGLGFEAGIAHPESLIEDRPTAFGSYVPTNFDSGYQGTVTVRAALQRSLNVPAVSVLDAVGPAMLLARMERAGMRPKLPAAAQPGLAIGLGGVGVRLDGLVALYAAIARGGVAVELKEHPGPTAEGVRVLSAEAAWHVSDILAEAPRPVAASVDAFAFKTGTSYGYRDAWAVGFDGRHVIGVWVGRPDGAPVPGITGFETAAPILFEALGRLKSSPDPLPPPPPGVILAASRDLPAPLRRVRGPRQASVAARAGPELAFPPDGARLDLGLGRGGAPRLPLRVRNGTGPFTWLVNGRPMARARQSRETLWTPDSTGFTEISVIDAKGRAARSRVYLD